MSGPNDITIKLGLDDAQLPAPVQRINAAISSIGKTGEISARQTAAAMRTLPAQFTDVATQLAGGQNPLLILLQQGGQIKDSFGGIGPAVRAVTSAITPAVLGMGALVGGIGAFAAAALQGQQESAQLRDTLALTGNAAGLSGARFQALAETTAAASAQSTGSVREIILELARTGQVTSSVISSAATAVARMADVTGQDTKKIAADFATMSGGVAKWAAEHNKAWNFITAEQYKYISRLEQQGKAEEAAIYVNQRVIEHLGQQKESIGLLEGAWSAMGRAAKGAWDDMLGVGRDETDIERVRNLVFKRDRAERVQGTPILEWLMGSPEDIQKQIDTANRDLLRNVERGMEASSKAITERQKIDAERKREAAARTGGGGSAVSGVLMNHPTFDEAFPVPNFGLIESLRRDNQSSQQAFMRSEIEAYKGIREYELRQQELDRERRERELGDAEKERLRMERDLRQSAERLSAEAGRSLYEDTRSAVSAAFRDSDDPIKAFGNALANTIYTRVTSSLIDALATAAVGGNGQGGVAGLIASFFKYSGSSTNPSAGNYENSFDLMTPPPPLATGTNFVPRNMIAELHTGEAVVPQRYNPAAGGGGIEVHIHNNTGTQVEATSRRRSDGGIDVVLRALSSQIAGDVATGQGEITQALQGRYGLRPTFG